MSVQNNGQQQFDFWVGEWDLTWADGGRGHNSISHILDGKIIQESFTSIQSDDTPPFQGLSVSAYNANNNQWRQTWVDNQGVYLDFVGGWADGRMVLQREATIQGKTIQQRMVWADVTADSIEWSWERSEDDGQTWQAVWQIHYQRQS